MSLQYNYMVTELNTMRMNDSVHAHLLCVNGGKKKSVHSIIRVKLAIILSNTVCSNNSRKCKSIMFLLNFAKCTVTHKKHVALSSSQPVICSVLYNSM